LKTDRAFLNREEKSKSRGEKIGKNGESHGGRKSSNEKRSSSAKILEEQYAREHGRENLLLGRFTSRKSE